MRDEEVLTSAYDITVITCAEGAHVSANEAVATGYLTDGAQQRRHESRLCREQLTQLQYAYSSLVEPCRSGGAGRGNFQRSALACKIHRAGAT